MTEMNWDTKKPEINTEQLVALKVLAEECWAERQQIKADIEAIEERKRETAKKEYRIKEILEDTEMDTFVADNCQCLIENEQSISAPHSPEEWAKFKEWVMCTYPNAYEGFFKMHVTSLKSFVAKEFEKAKELGVEDFQIPGIPTPTSYTQLVIKKKTKNKKQIKE